MSPGPHAQPVTCHPFQFEGLPYYTRDEAAVWNWCRQFLRGAPEWKTWVQEAWGDLLEAPAGFGISLVQEHSVDAQQEQRKHDFEKLEIFIGREAENDIAIPTRSAGKRHARVFVEGGRCFVEDLGSSLGTYLNQERLSPHAPAALKNGDAIAIFPHVFTVSLRQLWTRQAEIGVYPASTEPMSWQAFLNTSGMGRASFSIEVHPARAAFCLEAGRAFLMEFVDRLLRPLELEARQSSLTSSDSGILEFLILSLLERVNRDLAFPFQFDTGACGSRPQFAPDTRGVAITWSLNLLEITGALRIFAPYSLMDAMRPGQVLRPNVPVPAVSWNFPVSLGHTQLLSADIAGLETNDIVLFDPDLELLLPGEPDRGWKARPNEMADPIATLLEASNLRRLRIDKYFERERLNGGRPQTGEIPIGSPDLSGLPLRVHVILAERELTLAEASGLASGTILEIDGGKNGTVALAINGKILGEGQLVEVEGRLGVKILAWKGA